MITLILVATLAGSFFNIPVFKLKTVVPVVKDEFVSFFGILYRVPQVEYGERTTVLAVNVGGAIIPAIISIYLLWKQTSATFLAIIGVAVVAAVTHLSAKPVKGVGIITPAFPPPIIAAITAYLLSPSAP